MRLFKTHGFTACVAWIWHSFSCFFQDAVIRSHATKLLHDKYLDIGKLFGGSFAGRAATTGHAHTEQMRVERLFVRVSSLGKVASESVIRVFVFGCRGLSALGQVPPAPKEDTPLVCHQLTLGVEGSDIAWCP